MILQIKTFYIAPVEENEKACDVTKERKVLKDQSRVEPVSTYHFCLMAGSAIATGGGGGGDNDDDDDNNNNNNNNKVYLIQCPYQQQPFKGDLKPNYTTTNIQTFIEIINQSYNR